MTDQPQVQIVEGKHQSFTDTFYSNDDLTINIGGAAERDESSLNRKFKEHIDEPEGSSSYLVGNIVRPLGVTGIIRVEVINRSYVPEGTFARLVKDGQLQRCHIGGFLQSADLKVTFNVSGEHQNLDKLIFQLERGSTAFFTEQCTLKMGIIENAVTDWSRYIHTPMVNETKNVTVVIPFLEGLACSPFYVGCHTVRLIGCKNGKANMWRIRLRVLQSEDRVNVASISDSAIDTVRIAENWSYVVTCIGSWKSSLSRYATRKESPVHSAESMELLVNS